MAPPGNHLRRGGIAVAAVLGAAGLTVGVAGLHGQQEPAPRPAAASESSQASTPTTTTAQAGQVLGPSVPTRLVIPAIGVDSDLLSLGLNPDHTVQVPPYERDSKAGWYRYSVTPGQRGPAVLLGHVHSARYGPGVFFDLGALHRGDTVAVTRADDTVAVFRIDAVSSYVKDAFPTRAVYGNTDHAALRLITCGGDYDPDDGGYEDNVVAFASLIAANPA